jgi:hypothetical protein
LVPRKVDFFRGDVAKVSTGLDATAVITSNDNNNLYIILIINDDKI